MVTEISREELREKIEHSRDLVVIEALSPEDYRQSHIPGSLNIPPEQVYTLAREIIPHRDSEVVVYSAGPT